MEPEVSRPVPPYAAPTGVPCQVPWMTVPNLEEPPETTKPLEVERPAAVTPPVKVVVAEPVTARLVVEALVNMEEVANRVPAEVTLRLPLTVDEALAMKPEF